MRQDQRRSRKDLYVSSKLSVVLEQGFAQKGGLPQNATQAFAGRPCLVWRQQKGSQGQTRGGPLFTAVHVAPCARTLSGSREGISSLGEPRKGNGGAVLRRFPRAGDKRERESGGGRGPDRTRRRCVRTPDWVPESLCSNVFPFTGSSGGRGERTLRSLSRPLSFPCRYVSCCAAEVCLASFDFCAMRFYGELAGVASHSTNPGV